MIKELPQNKALKQLLLIIYKNCVFPVNLTLRLFRRRRVNLVIVLVHAAFIAEHPHQNGNGRVKQKQHRKNGYNANAREYKR